jgi:hypothetical protein
MIPKHEPEVLAARGRRAPGGYPTVTDVVGNIRGAICADLRTAEADYNGDPSEANHHRIATLRRWLVQIKDWPQ